MMALVVSVIMASTLLVIVFLAIVERLAWCYGYEECLYASAW